MLLIIALLENCLKNQLELHVNQMLIRSGAIKHKQLQKISLQRNFLIIFLAQLTEIQHFKKGTKYFFEKW
jgi:hypothetical protein